MVVIIGISYGGGGAEADRFGIGKLGNIFVQEPQLAIGILLDIVLQ